MNLFIATLAGFFIIYATVITTVTCVDLHGTQVTKDQLVSLTRDHFGRTDPDSLLNGFFPVWGIIQLFLAAFFLAIGIISGICYLFGCRTPSQERNKQLT